MLCNLTLVRSSHNAPRTPAANMPRGVWPSDTAAAQSRERSVSMRAGSSVEIEQTTPAGASNGKGFRVRR